MALIQSKPVTLAQLQTANRQWSAEQIQEAIEFLLGEEKIKMNEDGKLVMS